MNKALHPQLPARVWRFMRRYPVLPGFIIMLLVVMGLFASQISPQDPLDSKLSDTGAPPVWVSGGSWDHILGADHIGRDLLSRIIHGTRISLMVASVVLTAGMGHFFVFHLSGHLYTVHLLLAGADYRQSDYFGAEDVDSFVRIVGSFLNEC